MTAWRTLNQQEVEQLAGALEEKARSLGLEGHALVEQVIVDTMLTVEGVLPLEAWLNPAVQPEASPAVSGPETAEEGSFGEGMRALFCLLMLGVALVLILAASAVAVLGSYWLAGGMVVAGWLLARWAFRHTRENFMDD